jgi:hypothetical protein
VVSQNIWDTNNSVIFVGFLYNENVERSNAGLFYFRPAHPKLNLSKSLEQKAQNTGAKLFQKE